MEAQKEEDKQKDEKKENKAHDAKEEDEMKENERETNGTERKAKEEKKEEEEVDFDIEIKETTTEDRKAILSREKRGMCADDFEVLEFLGEGSYAKVVQARHKDTGKVYALKVILKKHMKKVLWLVAFRSKRRNIKSASREKFWPSSTIPT